MRDKCRKEEKRLLKREREIFKMNEKRVRHTLIDLRNKMFTWVAPAVAVIWIVTKLYD